MYNSNEIKVSIVIPVYNAEPFLEQCVRSLMLQTHQNIEYLFIDDASVDKSLYLLKSLIDQFPTRRDQCKIFESEVNKGVAFCRRLGIKNATGDYLIHVDSDDYVSSDFIEKMLSKALDTQSDVVICNFSRVYKDKIEPNSNFQKLERNELIKHLLIGTAHNALWNKLVRRTIIVENDLYPDDCFRILEDKSISFRVVYFAKKVEYINESLYFYRKRGGSLTKNNQRVLIPMLKLILRLIDDFFIKYPSDDIIDSGINAFKVGATASMLIYKPDDANLKDLLREVPISIIRTNTYIPFYYRVALYAQKLGMPWIVSIIRKIIDVHSGYNKSGKKN
ncbi:MAG: glycosyltransferase family 2 protein [Muribaculaceae bacterium]|nr:glycosyltransferase family 2 protein [Muribaculaceae bacterium]